MNIFFLLILLTSASKEPAYALTHTDCPHVWQGYFLSRVVLPDANDSLSRLECEYLGKISPEQCKAIPLPTTEGSSGTSHPLCRNYLNERQEIIVSIFDPAKPNERPPEASHPWPEAFLRNFPVFMTLLFAIFLFLNRRHSLNKNALTLVCLIAWAAYALYSHRMREWEKTVANPIRVDLLILYPLLGILSLAGFAHWMRLFHEKEPQ